ncbi:MAG: hypothetical protein JRD89_01480 [Deltaproteobacteria bacterium]|nr:hypothetical protein [Deltaproteobacteria bacterium]
MAKTTLKIKDKDRGLKKITREMSKFKRKVVAVGILQKDAPRLFDTTETGERALTNAEIGYLNEYGIGVPERSFIRVGVDEAKGKIIKVLKKGAGEVLVAQMSVDQALRLTGVYVKGSLVQRINKGGVFTPNHPETIARKGSSKPLIDTGQLKGSIDFEIKAKTP